MEYINIFIIFILVLIIIVVILIGYYGNFYIKNNSDDIKTILNSNKQNSDAINNLNLLKNNYILKDGIASFANGKVKIDTSGNTLITKNINVGGYLDLGIDDKTRDQYAGKIGYGGFSGGTGDRLEIVGKGTTSGNRQIQLWDHVSIQGNLYVQNGINVNGDSIFNCNLITYKGWAIHRDAGKSLYFAHEFGDWGNGCRMGPDGGFECKYIKIGPWKISQDGGKLIFSANNIGINTGEKKGVFAIAENDGNLWNGYRNNWMSNLGI